MHPDLLLGGLLMALLCLWVGARVQAWLSDLGRARDGRRHKLRGEAAERDAERLLEKAGYRVQARQARAGYELWVDGRQRAVDICADLVVHDGQQRWVAEVKTGQRGSRVGFRGTRRQLLEYQLAFGVSGVLLVDPERGKVSQVRFPFSSTQAPAYGPAQAWGMRLLWLGAGAACAALWMLRHR